MKHELFFTLILGFSFYYSPAQTQYTIRGRIASADNKPLDAAVLLIRAKDSSTITSAITDNDGTYKISSADIQDCILKVEASGYISWYSKTLSIIPDQVINITPQKNTTLSEIAITSRKPVYEQKADRMVFNVENSATAAGSDSWGILKKTPGVLIMNNQVTIAGKGNVGVMLNGRIQQVSGEDLAQMLRSIPADNLSKIEVITAPPARYDAEGNTGLINIVTKKNVKQGLRGSVTAAYRRNNYGNPSLSTTLSYRSEKWNITCNANAGIYAYKYTNHTNTYYPDQNWEQKLVQGYFNKNARVQIAVDYSLNKNMNVGLILGEGMNRMDNPDSIVSKSFNSHHQQDSVLRTKGESHDKFNGKHSVNFNYEWRFGETGKKLNIDADYYSHKGTRERVFETSTYYNSEQAISSVSNRMTGNPAVDIRSIKADLELPFKWIKLTTGARVSEVKNDADNIHEQLVGGTYVTDLSKTNAFYYTEQIQAAYITLQKKIDKIDIQAGLRAEHTYTKGYSATLKQTNENDYTQLFPSGYIQYTMNENNAFNLNYSRRINRPSYSFLNPFRVYYTENAFIEGNPYLKPSFRNGVELNYTLKSKYFFKTFFSQTDNYWDRIIETDTMLGTTRYTRANIGRAQWSGVSAAATITPYKWWELRVSANLEHNDFRLRHFNGTDHLSSTFPWVDMNHTFFLDKKKTLTAELYAYYYAPRQKDYKIWDEMSTVNIGFRKSMMSNNFIVAVSFEDIFAKTYWYQTNVANGTTEFSYDNDRAIRFSLTYKFGNKEVKSKRDKSVMEEIQRAQ